MFTMHRQYASLVGVIEETCIDHQGLVHRVTTVRHGTPFVACTGQTARPYADSFYRVVTCLWCVAERRMR